jgi:hypothetical protein
MISVIVLLHMQKSLGVNIFLMITFMFGRFYSVFWTDAMMHLFLLCR